MEKRLRELLGTLPAMKTEEEILSAKMRVHDEIGPLRASHEKISDGPGGRGRGGPPFCASGRP
jgi:hypothetical protein